MKVIIILFLAFTFFREIKSEILTSNEITAFERQLAVASNEEKEIIKKFSTALEKLMKVQTGFIIQVLSDQGSFTKIEPNFEQVETQLIYQYKKSKEDNQEVPLELFRIIVTRKVKAGSDSTSIEGIKKVNQIYFEFTNKIVNSKIAITYGASGVDMLDNFINRSCFNYLQKIEQSVFGLAAVFPSLESVAKMMDDLFLKTLVDPKIKKLTTVTKFYDFKNRIKEPSTISGDLTQSPPLLKMVVDLTAGLSGNSQDQSREYIIFEVTPEFGESQPINKPDFTSYIDVFYVIIVSASQKISLTVSSKHFSDSVEISVNSKLAVMENLNNLCSKVITQTFQHFIDLELPVEECKDGFSYFDSKASGLKWTDSLVNDEAQMPAGVDLHKQYEHVLSAESKILLYLYKVKDGDALVSVRLLPGQGSQKMKDQMKSGLESQNQNADSQKNSDGINSKDINNIPNNNPNMIYLKAVIERQTYFPLVSQFCTGPLILSFVEKMKQDFMGMALSSALLSENIEEETIKKMQAEIGTSSHPFIEELEWVAGRQIEMRSSEFSQQIDVINKCGENLSDKKENLAWKLQLCYLENENGGKRLKYQWVSSI